MSIYKAVIDLIGVPPAGYDIIVWIVCAVILLYIITSAFSILAAIFNFASGKK